jgi:hypothetical protein
MLRVHFYNVPPVDMPDGSDRVVDIWTTADGRFLVIREEDGKPIEGAVIMSRDGTQTIASKTLPVMDNDHLRSLHRLLSEGLDYPGYSVLPVLVAEIEAREIGYFEPRAVPEIKFTFEERSGAAIRRVKNALKHANDQQRRAFLLELSAVALDLLNGRGSDMPARDDQGAVIPEILKTTPVTVTRNVIQCGGCLAPALIFRDPVPLAAGSRLLAEDCYFVECCAHVECFTCKRRVPSNELVSKNIKIWRFEGATAIKIFESDQERAARLARFVVYDAKDPIWRFAGSNGWRNTLAECLSFSSRPEAQAFAEKTIGLQDKDAVDLRVLTVGEASKVNT